ncbi:MAG: hypothetical protein H6815_01365 [Phycisphaeraceae bacterium]|nr:hypothetical protein [Phycisphaerales bacterium]MCB9859076.1 hypothetical protein [Phycisphaeraceae bacterium]
MDRFEHILESITKAFGDLSKPHYGFMEQQQKKLLLHPIISELISRFILTNDTDLNADHSLHLRVGKKNLGQAQASVQWADYAVRLSFVHPWAAVFRISKQSGWYEEVIEPSTPGISRDDMEMLDVLEIHGFKLLTRSELQRPIQMRLFDTSPEDIRVYHALVADEPIRPSPFSG